MGKFAFRAAIAALVGGQFILPVSAANAAPDPTLGPDVVAYCRFHITEPGYTTGTIGECASYIQTIIRTEAGFVSHLCDGWEETDPGSFYSLFNSHSECVRALRS